MRHTSRRFRIAVPAALLTAIATAVVTATALGSSAATPIKIAILSDCQGAFGAFDNQDLGGAVAALSQYAGAKPKNPNLPRAGFTGASVAGHPIKLVGVGCSNDRADTAIRETRRLVEQLGADIQIGPLSGDESIAVANYAKAHPKKTFINGTAAAQDTTLHVRAPNFFRFNADGAQWNAGTGDLAYHKLHWKTAAVIMDDYSFAWTSAAGFIAEFCGVGGKVTSRVFPPLNTTDYSSFVQQLPAPNKVDGYFWAVGGSGLIPSLKAFEQAYGPIKGSQFIGNLFWGTPGSFQELGTRAANAIAGGFGTAPDLKTPAAIKYSNIVGKWIKAMPPLAGTGKQQSGSGFVYNYYNNTWAMIKALQAVKGDLSGGQKALQAALNKVQLDSGYGHIKLDKNRNAIADQYTQQLYLDSAGKLNVKTIQFIPQVDQTFGGTFSNTTPSPGRSFPPCVKRSLPWIGKERPVVNGVVK